MNGPSEHWRKKRGIIYPERHVAFVLDGPDWPEEPPPPLPASKDAFHSAKILDRSNPKEAQKRLIKADQMRRREESGEIEWEDFRAGRDAIDTLLLCGKKNPQALAMLAEILGYGLLQLQTLTEQTKSKRGAAELTVLLSLAVQRLKHLADKSPELLRNTARHLPSFPLLASRYKEQQLENERLLDNLDVGAEHWWKQHRKERMSPSPSKSARAKQIAIQLIEYLHTYRTVCREVAVYATDLPAWTRKLRYLPKLSEKSWPKWFALGWEVVRETTGGRPSEIDAYRKIASRKRRINVHNKVVDATHSAIQDALRDAFKELATGESARSAQRHAETRQN